MKKEIITEILKKLNTKPNLMRKLKIFAIVGIVGFIFVGGLTIWVGISAFNYIAIKAKETVKSPAALNHIDNLKSEFSNLPKLQALSCWSTAQSLMTAQPWLEKSAVDNLVTLKTACLELKPAVCEGAECENIKIMINTVEGKTI